ncbi:MAG: S1 RNA-binding domain-containing protein [Planctomycetaceae bacterium]
MEGCVEPQHSKVRPTRRPRRSHLRGRVQGLSRSDSATSQRQIEFGATIVIPDFEPGAIIEATVTQIESFGAFVEHRGFRELVRIPEIAWHRIRFLDQLGRDST